MQMQKLLDSSEDRRARIELNPFVVIITAIENCRPVMALEKVKVGSVTYHVPTPITETK
jgi:ribosomal protein S7